MNNKPFPESYWVIPGQFLAGGYPGLRFDEIRTRQRLSSILIAGFDTFIDLTNENERTPYYSILNEEAGYAGREVRHLRFSYPDYSVPSHETMVVALDAIDEALAEGRKVYLHCVGGIGRTGITVGCYLVRHGMRSSEALRHLRELYRASAQSLVAPDSPESDEQARFILNWEENGLA
ncbi:MAG TPA: dual specificity protein phosphatase family protein [Anaerolineales bacterium]